MGCLGELRGDMEGAATPDPVAALAAQMQAQLRDLTLRHECLVRRIQKLRQIMRGLGAISSAIHSRVRGTASRAGHKSATAPFPANRAAGVCARHLRDAVEHRMKQMKAQLQRACRIALLETEKPVSLEEIRLRIVRRGSFSFVNPKLANPALLHALNAMAEDGEVRVLDSAPGWRWERMTPLKESWRPAPRNTAGNIKLG